jgi:hypothetical protein
VVAHEGAHRVTVEGSSPGRGGRPRSRVGRLVKAAAAVVGALVGVAVLAAVLVYLNRLDLARRGVLAWFRGQGVEADMTLTALSPTGLTARLRIGPKDHPDLTVDRAELTYSLDGVLSGKSLTVSKVRLDHPVLIGRWRQGKLSLGAIDRLLAGIRPSPGGPPAPPVEVRSAVLRLDTDYGPIEARGDADLSPGARLDRLEARLSPASLHAGAASATLRDVTVSARRTGDRLLAAGRASASGLRFDQAQASDLTAGLQADLSYTALERGRIDGRLSADAQAGSAISGEVSVERVRLDLQSPSLKLDGKTGSGAFHLRASAGAIRQGDMRLAGLSSEGAGRVSLDAAGAAAQWTGGLSGSGVWPALGGPKADDAPVMIAVKRSLKAFRFSVGKAEFALDHGRVSGRLLAPVQVRSASGGKVDLDPAPGGYDLTIAGGGLPTASAQLRRVAFTGTGATAEVAATAAFSLGLLDDAQVEARGKLTVRGTEARFAAAGCAPITVRRLDFGDNSAEGFSAEACPGDRPALTVSPQRWTLAARVRGAAAKVPMFEVGLSGGAGSMSMEGHGDKVSADLKVEEVKVTDLARPLRFHPLFGLGHAVLAGDVFSGGFDGRTPKGLVLAHADFRQEIKAMKGGMTVSVPGLTFAQGGLQPTDLSPLTAALGEPASGQVAFKARFDWVGDKVTSSGTLSARDLNFKSPAGPVTGANGEMVFSSLTPVLVGASTGPLRVSRIAGLVPMTDVTANARIDDQTLTLPDAQGTVAGGTVRLQATASLGADQTVKGEVVMDKVQVRDLIKASPFGDRVSMTAEISGRMPFRMSGGQLRFAQGAAQADGPGRLSINRNTFNPGGVAGAANQDNLSTFGYQAMENLAFQSLEASIKSLPDGRLGMVFHIKGRHDPPTRKELRLTWRDFFDRGILNKTMPLPSDTEVNLTLDTTLNLDNLIRSYADLHQQIGSPPVQPPSATLGAEISESHQ